MDVPYVPEKKVETKKELLYKLSELPEAADTKTFPPVKVEKDPFLDFF